MRQIPSEGEYCGECCCLTYITNASMCLRYGFAQEEIENPRRLQRCRDEQPQVLTEEEREGLKGAGIDMMAEAIMKEAHHEPR